MGAGNGIVAGFNGSGWQLSDSAVGFVSLSPSKSVPFDAALSRQIKPYATWVVPGRPIDKFRTDPRDR